MLYQNDRSKAAVNAEAFNDSVAKAYGPVSWPSGVYYVNDTIEVAYCGVSVAGGGAAYALPTSQYTAANNGGTASTVLIGLDPAKPVLRLASNGGAEFTGLQIQHEDFRRVKGNPVPAARNGSVGVEFVRGSGAPGGKATFGTVSFVGFDQAIKFSAEANHVVFVNAVFQHNWTCVRSEHDQAFGVHFVHAQVSGHCDRIMDFERGGKWHAEYVYTNSPVLVARFNNLSANRSIGSVGHLYVDANAKGWRLLETVGEGSFCLEVGGHVQKEAVPASDWIKGDWSGSYSRKLDVSRWWDPYHVCPASPF